MGDDADPAVIRAAYRRAVRRVHPDLNPALSSTEETIRLREAYELLMTPASEVPHPNSQPDPTSQPGPTSQTDPTSQTGPTHQTGPIHQTGPTHQTGRARANRQALRGDRESRAQRRSRDVLAVRLSGNDTVTIRGSQEEAVVALLDAAHQLGEVTYADASAGFFEVLVEFADAPTASLALALQGRSSGEIDVFCSVEPLSGGEAPPVGAITRLLHRTLAGDDPTR